MEKIDWTNQYERIHPDKLERELINFAKAGFKYFPLDEVYLSPEYVETPDGKKFTREDIKKILSGKLIFGDRCQLEAIKVLDFLKIAEAYY